MDVHRELLYYWDFVILTLHSNLTVLLYLYTVGDDSSSICFHTSHFHKSKEKPGLGKKIKIFISLISYSEDLVHIVGNLYTNKLYHILYFLKLHILL